MANGRKYAVKTKFALLIVCSIAAIVIGAGVGSVYVSPADIASVVSHRLFATPLAEGIPPSYVSMILDMRLPRVLLAFITGGALAVSGTVMQSVLQNPLASPFGIGVSAGAGLGASLVIVLGLSAGILGAAALPSVSLLFALLTVFLVVFLSSRFDGGMSNVTIVLVGMVVSLFCTAIISMLASAAPEYAQRITLWQTGSFSMKEWSAVFVLAPVTVFAVAAFSAQSRELDVMTFGDEQARAMGVDLGKVKTRLLAGVAMLTGAAVAFAGIIGFVDLVVPFIVRKWFGAAHRRILPAAALTGGVLLVLCDLAARTVIGSRELPVGGVTAFLGAPFFLYIFLKTRRR